MRTTMDEALMLDYASGALPEPVALAVATHLSLNERARGAYGAYQALGGLLLDSLDGEELSETCLETVLSRLDEDDSRPRPVRPALDDKSRAILPDPLQAYVPKSLSALDWKRKGAGVEEARLPVADRGYRVSLLKITPGQAMPHHTHRGCEYTVVLDGAYDDDGTRFGRGDFSVADAADRHQPIADAETGCLCLIVLDQPVKLTGPLGWVVNPFLKN